MSERLTVTQLNTRVKELLSSTPSLKDFWVIGEISNFKVYSNGHAYFVIKDTGSAINATMFRTALSRLDFMPGDSMKVEAFGHLDIYVPSGRYSLIIDTMRKSGIGDIYQRFEALKKKLEGEGYFKLERKRPLPVYPKTIGVVTSPTGAVIHDILTTTKRRFPADILLAPAKVQGDGAVESIVKGIELLNKVGVDVIIVGRGGGSLEDLWAFNEEAVVKAIAASKVPVISSVGHETDTTLADYAADQRAATPTAAAQFAVRDKEEIRKQIDALEIRADNALRAVTDRMRARFSVLDAKLSPKTAEERIGYLSISLDQLFTRAQASIRNCLSTMHSRFSVCEKRPEAALRSVTLSRRASTERVFARIEPSMREVLKERRASSERLSSRVDAPMNAILLDKKHSEQNISARLEALSPYRVLDRGYSFVAGPDGRAVTSVKGLQVGSVITVRMRDGKAEANITDKEEFQ